MIFTCYLAIFALIALLLAWFQPVQATSPILADPPDEFSRITIPQYIWEHGRLPTGFEPEVQIPGYGGSYAFFPYLPYILMGLAGLVVRQFTQSAVVLTMTARLVNVACGLAMAVTIYYLSRRLFRDRGFRWLYCFLVMYWPEQLFLHTYVNTESMSQLSIAMILLALTAMYQDGPDLRHCVLLSAGLIFCLLTYYNAYGYVLAAVVLFCGLFLFRGEPLRKEMRQMLRYGLPVLLLTVAGAGWWFVRNAVNLDGDLFGMAAMRKVRAPLENLFPPTYLRQGKTILQMFRENDLFSLMVRSFIASYGSNSILAGPGLYLFYKIFLFGGAALAVFFAVYPAVLGRRNRSKTAGRCLENSSGVQSGVACGQPSGKRPAGSSGQHSGKRSGRRLFFHLVMMAAMLSVGILWLYYSYAMDYQPQGRYLLATIIPLFYYMTAGWMHLADALKLRGILRRAAIALAILLVVFWEADFVLGTVLPICVSVVVS